MCWEQRCPLSSPAPLLLSHITQQRESLLSAKIQIPPALSLALQKGLSGRKGGHGTPTTGQLSTQNPPCGFPLRPGQPLQTATHHIPSWGQKMAFRLCMHVTAQLNPTDVRLRRSQETCLLKQRRLRVQEHGRAKMCENMSTTAQPPVPALNTLFFVKAHARSTHFFPSCTDLIKSKRSCHSRPADQPKPAVRFDDGYRLYCQILSNQLSCFAGFWGFFFPFLWLFCSGLHCAGRLLPGSWANHSHCSPCMPQTEGFHWSSM